jgi:hypothetical protein
MIKIELVLWAAISVAFFIFDGVNGLRFYVFWSIVSAAEKND